MGSSLAVTAKGQVTLKRELLQHLGIKPGERVEFEKLPDGELRLRAARPTRSIDMFLNILNGKVKRKRPLTMTRSFSPSRIPTAPFPSLSPGSGFTA